MIKKDPVNPPIIASRISLRRAGQVICKDIEFEVKTGEILHIKGANAVGKSSLLRCVAGLLPPFKGAITGCPSSQKIRYIGHAEPLKPELTLIENFRLFASCYGAFEDIETALSSFNLDRLATIPIRLFSAGQKKRASLARLLLGDSQLWLIDEPLTGLDAKNRAGFEKIMTAHIAKNGQVIVTSHEPIICTKKLNLGADYHG